MAHIVNISVISASIRMMINGHRRGNCRTCCLLQLHSFLFIHSEIFNMRAKTKMPGKKIMLKMAKNGRLVSHQDFSTISSNHQLKARHPVPHADHV